MKVKGLDNREYTLSLIGKESKSVSNKSKYHILAREVIKRIYPSLKLAEEVHIPGLKTPMYLDFFMPLMKIAVEVQGEQHYKFNSFFHVNKMEFFQAKSRDRMKKSWCELNDISIVELPYNETEEQWEERLSNVFRTT